MNICALFKPIGLCLFMELYMLEGAMCIRGIQVHQLHQLYEVNFAILVNLVVLVNIMGLGA